MPKYSAGSTSKHMEGNSKDCKSINGTMKIYITIANSSVKSAWVDQEWISIVILLWTITYPEVKFQEALLNRVRVKTS